MGLTLWHWKIIYSSISFVLTSLSYCLSYFLEFDSKKDLAEMFFGSSMISIALVFMTIDCQAYYTDKYPYSFLIALISFTVLTFFTFIKDSLALLDDTLLVKCDIVNSAPLPTQEDTQQTEDDRRKFSLLDNFVSTLLFLISCLECASFGLTIASYGSESDLHGRLPFILPVRFLQLVCISTFLKEMRINGFIYTVLAIVNATCVLVFGSIKQFASLQVTDICFGVSSALLVGCFLYFGASAIHNSRVTYSHSSISSILCSLIGFGIPVVFRVFVKHPSK